MPLPGSLLRRRRRRLALAALRLWREAGLAALGRAPTWFGVAFRSASIASSGRRRDSAGGAVGMRLDEPLIAITGAVGAGRIRRLFYGPRFENDAGAEAAELQ